MKGHTWRVHDEGTTKGNRTGFCFGKKITIGMNRFGLSVLWEVDGKVIIGVLYITSCSCLSLCALLHPLFVCSFVARHAVRYGSMVHSLQNEILFFIFSPFSKTKHRATMDKGPEKN